MIRGTFASFLLGSILLAESAPSDAGPLVKPSSKFDTVIVLAQAPAQEAPPNQTPQETAPNQNPQSPTSPTPPSQPTAPSQNAPELPPVKVIEPQQKPVPKPKKPAQIVAKRAPTPRPPLRSAPAVNVTASRPSETIATVGSTEAAVASAESTPQSVAMSPLSGSEIPIEKVPGAVGQVSGAVVERQATPAVEDALQQRVPGVIVSDQQGNSFQTNVQYRGFEASPVNGVPQGLAVYQNGVRINEVFGDIVNWDFIPSNAIKDITVLSGNPLFGLNALGGSISLTMKDGFGFQGAESDTRFGSWGRRQESLQGGAQSNNVAAYVALETIHDDGWRDASPSAVHRMYADIGIRPSSESEFHINYSAAANFVGVAAPSPIELLNQDWSKVFTTPQTTFNRLSMTSINGSVGITSDWKLSGVAYYREFRQKHVDGNVSDADRCDSDSGLLCLGGDVGDVPDPIVRDRAGNPINANQFGDIIGEIDRTTNVSNSLGGSVQATNKTPILGHTNQFVIGTSIDHGRADTTSSAELGTVDPNTFVVTGSQVFPFFPIGLTPTNLTSTTNYYGLFAIDTLDLTKRLALTIGGRYNFADINLQDNDAAFKEAAFPGEDSNLSGDHIFVRFNPSIGATYKLTPGISLYGGYAEANRAPTPAELACSNPNQPCLLENFLVSDPSLSQVVSHTWQAGLRGNFEPKQLGGKVNWSLGLYHTLDTNDIINVLDPVDRTRGFFQNAGNTLRQGIEASASYSFRKISLYANYALVDATFQSNLTLPSPNNPLNTTNADDFSINVHPGDHLPAIPEHRIKAGFDYQLMENWKAGADVVYASSQYFVGDESNQNAKIPAYAVMNLHTSYDINKHFQIYALVNNLFDNKYALYGTYFEAEQVNLTDPRTETPAQPFSVYGGFRIKF